MTERIGYKEKKSFPVYVNFTEEEFAKMKADFDKSIYRNRCEYLRKKILDIPVTYYIRNKSLDELTSVLLAIKYNQESTMVKFDLAELILADHTDKQKFQEWANLQTRYKRCLCEDSEKINETLLKIYHSCYLV